VVVQEAQRGQLMKGMSEGMLCAYVNNNMRCYNESTEFADLMEDSLDEPFKVQCTLPTLALEWARLWPLTTIWTIQCLPTSSLEYPGKEGPALLHTHCPSHAWNSCAHFIPPRVFPGTAPITGLAQGREGGGLWAVRAEQNLV
jgi:hypothetical protein